MVKKYIPIQYKQPKKFKLKLARPICQNNNNKDFNSSKINNKVYNNFRKNQQ